MANSKFPDIIIKYNGIVNGEKGKVSLTPTAAVSTKERLISRETPLVVRPLEKNTADPNWSASVAVTPLRRYPVGLCNRPPVRKPSTTSLVSRCQFQIRSGEKG
jgi:hypothetical protein